MTPERALEMALAQWRGDRLAETTVNRYSRDVRRLEREVGPLLDDPKQVERRLHRWREDQQELSDAGKITASKIAADLISMRAFFVALMARGAIKVNPTTGVQGVIQGRHRPRPIPIPDLERICNQPDVSTVEGLRDRTILECLRHGMRQNEVVRLNLGGIDCDEERQRVFLRFQAKGKASRARERDIPLSSSGSLLFARYMLEAYSADYNLPGEPLTALHKLLARLRSRATEPAFTTTTGRRLYQVWVNRMFTGYRESAGVDARWTPHTLRHRFCTHLLEQNVDLRRTQRLTGHSDIRSLMTYTEVTRGEAAVDMDVLGSAPVRESHDPR